MSSISSNSSTTPVDQLERVLDANAPKILTVPIGTGPPTKEELEAYYTPKFTWDQLKLFINSGYVFEHVCR